MGFLGLCPWGPKKELIYEIRVIFQGLALGAMVNTD